MKIRYAVLALTLITGLVINGCKKDPEPGPTAEEQQIEKLSKTWTLAASANAVTVEGVDVSADWSGFSLTIAEGTYTTSGAFSADVWPSSGVWSFLSETDLNTVVRDNVTNITISVTDNTLLMEFEYSSTGGRLNGIDGTWVFNMVSQ